MIYLLEDNEIMADCLATIIKQVAPAEDVVIFGDAISAVQSLDADNLPDLIFLDILLTGPNGFAFLNEIASYRDTARIPVVIITTLTLDQDLSSYGVVGILNKETMVPDDLKKYLKEYLKDVDAK